MAIEIKDVKQWYAGDFRKLILFLIAANARGVYNFLHSNNLYSDNLTMGSEEVEVNRQKFFKVLEAEAKKQPNPLQYVQTIAVTIGQPQIKGNAKAYDNIKRVMRDNP